MIRSGWWRDRRPRGTTDSDAGEEVAALLEAGLRPLRRVRRDYRAALEAHLLGELAALRRPWWRGTADWVVISPARSLAPAAVAVAVVLAAGGMVAHPALADSVGALLRQFRLRETAGPPPRPVIERDAPGTVRELPVEVAVPMLAFRLLAPTQLPPGYDPTAGVAQVRDRLPSSVTLAYVERGAEAKRWPAVLIHEVAFAALAPEDRRSPISAGTAEPVRIVSLDDAEERPGLYVVGEWVYRSGRTEAEYTPALHSVRFDRDGVRIYVQAARPAVSREQLLRVAASLAPATPKTAGAPGAPVPAAAGGG